MVAANGRKECRENAQVQNEHQCTVSWLCDCIVPMMLVFGLDCCFRLKGGLRINNNIGDRYILSETGRVEEGLSARANELYTSDNQLCPRGDQV